MPFVEARRQAELDRADGGFQAPAICVILLGSRGVTMDDISEYERRAAEATGRTEETEDAEVRERWMRMAAQWRSLAEQTRRDG